MSKKETKFNLEGLEEIATEQTPAQQEASENVLTEKELERVSKEIELERKYGNKDLRTFVESAASAASFGLSDQALVKYGGEEMKEALRERRQRNQEAALAGELTGVVGPAALSGGSTIAAKGLSAGVKTAAKTGSAVEKLTAKQLAKLVHQTGKKKSAKDVITKSISKSAGSGVEGAFYGAGQLVSEDALGTSEFNAENLLAKAGTAAMLGGTVGGILGSTEALIPVIKNNRVVDVVSKKINNNIDRRMAGAKLSKMTPNEISKLKETKWGQQIYDNIPSYYKNNLNLKITDNTEKLFNKSKKELSRLGEEIGDTAAQVDKLAAGTSILPTRSKIALKVQNSLRELTNEFKKSPDELAKKSLKKIEKRIESWDEWLNDDSIIKATDIKDLKTSLQKVTKWNKSIDQIPLDGKMDRNIAEAVRQEFLDLADNVSTIDKNIGEKLRKLNLDYGTALNVTNKLRRAVDKESASELLKFKDLLVADILTDISGGVGAATGAVVTKKFLESDLRRKLTILTNIEKANTSINKKISKGVSNFFSTAKKVAVPTSTKILMSTSFDIPDESGKRRRKPKNKKEAFENISNDLTEIQQNPEKLINHLSQNAMQTANAAPNTSLAITSTISRAVAFLYEKLPKDASPGTGLFNRKWEPSSLELSKFERYLEAVENPMSVIDDMESGSLTREGVEAIKVVYPDLYIRVQTEAIDKIANNPDISYDKRVQIGLLLDLPSDSSLIPANIMALQRTFAEEQQQQTAAKKDENTIKTTQKGLENIEFAEDAKTETQKTITRE